MPPDVSATADIICRRKSFQKLLQNHLESAKFEKQCIKIGCQIYTFAF